MANADCSDGASATHRGLFGRRAVLTDARQRVPGVRWVIYGISAARKRKILSRNLLAAARCQSPPAAPAKLARRL
jgi:hypothetical protein